MYKRTLDIAVMSLVIVLTTAYPGGAPNDVKGGTLGSHCQAGDFRPGHVGEPQTSAPLYKITVSKNSYKPGQPIDVTLEPLKHTVMRGFFIYVKPEVSGEEGDFTCDSGVSKEVTYCGEAGVTHTNNMIKDEIQCEWTPPVAQIGKVKFVATVVKNYFLFWTGIESQALSPDLARYTS